MTSVDPARTQPADLRRTTDPRDTRAADTGAGTGVSRRTLVKTAAWAVPAIAVAAPAPAYAASIGSTTNTIKAKFKAWFTKDRNDRFIDIIGTDSQHPAEGYFSVTDGVAGQAVTSVSVFALIDKNIADSAWTPRNNVGDVYWKKPVKVSGPDNGGYYTYRIDFRTPLTSVSAAGTLFLDARFHFRAPFQGNSVKVKGAWRAAIAPGAAPLLNATSTNTADLDSDGDWTYVTSPGA